MQIRRSTARLRPSLSRRVGPLALALATAGAGVALFAAPAHADAASNALLISNQSWLNVAVPGGSAAAGTAIIQWNATGGNEQRWTSYYYPDRESSTVHRLRNTNSGLCITTDGVAGDALTQQPCSADNPRQVWLTGYVWWAAGSTLYNPATGLNMDVAGASYGAGAQIDAWYPNNQLNQVFSMPGLF